MEDRKFKTAVSMKVTEEEYNKDLKKSLEELGYREVDMERNDACTILTTCWMRYADSLGVCFHGDGHGHFIDHYNPELFLALAGMTEGEVPIVGEYCHWNSLNKLEFVKVEKIRDSANYQFNSHYNHCNIRHIVKVTKEELTTHFSKEEKKCSCSSFELPKHLLMDFEALKKDIGLQSRFPMTLLPHAVSTVMEVCCPDWKQKLADKWGSELLKNGHIIVNESFYKEMRAACDDKQHKVLDEVFGKDEKSVRGIKESIIAFFIEKGEIYQGEYPLPDIYRLDDNTITKLLETFDITFKK